MRPMKTLALFCAVLLLALAAPAQAEPRNHAELMKNEAYKNSYEQYQAALDDAKGQFSADDYKKLVDKFESEISEAAAQDMKDGSSEAEAYDLEYSAAATRLGDELTYQWLRKNAEGIQGYYRFESEAFDGFMTVQKGEAPYPWAVYIYAVQKNAPYNNGEVTGWGALEGDKMNVNYANDDPAQSITVTFDGETARVESSQAFKDSGWLGGQVVIDGDYEREKK